MPRGARSGYNGARRPCTVCTIASRTLADAVELPSLALSDEVGRAIRADAERLTRSLMLAACRDFAWEGLPLGRLVEPSVLWFFNRGSLSDAHLPADSVTLVDVPAMAISSSVCRDRVRAGQPVWYLVPDGVVQYIAKQDLYRGGAT